MFGRSHWLAVTVWVAIIVGCNCAAGQGAIPSARPPSKSYPLHGEINSGDISPDEALIALERTSKHKTNGSEVRFAEVIEVWDFRADKLVAQVELREGDVKQDTYGHSFDPQRDPRFVRFTGDGNLVVAYCDHKLTIFQTKDLAVVRSIMLEGPPSVSRSFVSKRTGPHTVTDWPVVQALETAPSATLVAVLWTRGMLYGRLEIYDLSSGLPVMAWDPPGGWTSFDRNRGLSWSSTSQTVFLAVPSAIPCLSPLSLPDVFGLDARSGAIQTKITTGLLVGDIATTPRHEILAVDSNCVGVFKNHHPKLKVFDVGTGKHLRDVSAHGRGVRYRVSVSRNGQRAVAWTSDVKCHFDWGDMVCNDRSVNLEFTVWHLPDFSVIATSQDLYSADILRISSSGRYVLSYRSGQSISGATRGGSGAVYEFP
ncbi:MAG TPA: hypothetical protein VF011_12515 [Terriglobales bacterium]